MNNHPTLDNFYMPLAVVTLFPRVVAQQVSCAPVENLEFHMRNLVFNPNVTTNHSYNNENQNPSPRLPPSKANLRGNIGSISNIKKICIARSACFNLEKIWQK